MIENIIPSTFRRFKNSSYPLFVKIIEKYFSNMTAGRLVIKDPKRDIHLVFGKDKRVEAEINVNSVEFYRRLVVGGDIGLAETYMASMWDTPVIDDVIKWFILNLTTSPAMSGSRANISNPLINIKEVGNRLGHLVKTNSKRGAQKNISDHYDLGNDFFRLFLDPTMTYSSAVFTRATSSLEQAQQEKFRRLASAARMEDGLHVLEIGTGWGEFGCFLAENFDCKVTTTTISREQYEFAKNKVENRGLAHKVNVMFRDYRELTGQFDRLITVEMLEAVGDKFLPVFFQKANQLLKPAGLMTHQVILCPDSRYESLKNGIDFIQKHIFPGSLIPSLEKLMSSANEHAEYFLLGYDDFGKDYWKTIKMWQNQLNENQQKVKAMNFSQEFIRKWNYYFSYCATAFYMRNITVGHVTLTRVNNYELGDA